MNPDKRCRFRGFHVSGSDGMTMEFEVTFSRHELEEMLRTMRQRGQWTAPAVADFIVTGRRKEQA